MIVRTTLFLIATLTAPVFAADLAEPAPVTINTCDVHGELRLEAPTKIQCAGTLHFADDVVIVRDGFSLAIFSQRFEAGKAEITCFDAKSADADGKCEALYLYAFTLAGQPVIDTNGLRPTNLGGDVYRSYGSEDNFKPTYRLGPAAGLVDLTVAAR